MHINITATHWFRRDEIDLMRRCLEAIVSGRFIDNSELYLISGWNADRYRDLLGRFDAVAFEERALAQKDYEVICQAVGHLSGYPVAYPLELEQLLGVASLHLDWFWYRLRPIRDEWKQCVEEDDRLPRCASTIS